MKNITKPLICIFGIIFIFNMTGCRKKIEVIKIAGSDVMVNMVRDISTEFMKTHPGVLIEVSCGGDDGGLAGLIKSSCAIAMTTRSINKEEFELANKNNKKLMEYITGVEKAGMGKSPRKLLLLYTGSNPGPSTKKFIDFVLSTQGQEIIRRSGFEPIKK